MRRFIFITALILTFVPLALARSEEAAQSPSLRIETDEGRQAFNFVIDGKSVAFLDKTGLHVRGDVAYGGALRDEGPHSFTGSSNQTDKTNTDKETSDE